MAPSFTPCHSPCLCTWRQNVLCIFVSSPFIPSLVPPYHLFLHLSISAPVGIGKRCSSPFSMSSRPLTATDQWPPETPPQHACPVHPQSTSLYLFQAWVTCYDVTVADKPPDADIPQLARAHSVHQDTDAPQTALLVLQHVVWAWIVRW